MAVHACTIIARNYISAARVLANSFLAHHPGGTFAVLFIDDVRREADEEVFDVLRLEDIGFSEAEIHRFAGIYEITEFATAVKPWLLEHLVREFDDAVLYLDPDIVVFASLEELAEQTRSHELILTPHALKPMPRDGKLISESEVLAAGIYNLGFIGVGPASFPFLKFWQERLARDCIIDPEHMRFVDQRWVDFAPGMFDVGIIREPAYNVAYWNLDGRVVTFDGERYFVNGTPLRFFHFSGYDPRVPTLLSKYLGNKARILLSDFPVLKQLCDAYADAMREENFEKERSSPYAYLRLPTGVAYDKHMRTAYRNALTEAEINEETLPPNPFDQPQAFLSWLNEIAAERALPRYADEFYRARADIVAAHPDVAGRDYEAVVRNLQNEAREGRFDRRFLPPHVPDDVDDFHGFDPPPTPVDHDPGIRVAGYLRSDMGVGQLGRLALAAVRAAGIVSSTYVDTATVARQGQPIAEEARDDLNVNLVCVNADALPGFAYRMGASFFRDRYTIGLWAWELEEFPDQFAGAFDHVDEVWALSEFTRAAIASHTDKPVFTFTLPIEAPTIVSPLDVTSLGIPEGPYFLFAFDLMSIMERKNPLQLIEAFRRAFEPGTGPTLVIKALSGEHQLADLERLRLAARTMDDVVIIDHHLTRDENLSLMAQCACYVSLHRSEGYGLTIAEAMSLGRPVIATAYSGNLDFMTADTAYAVPYRDGAVPKGCDPYPVGAFWADPDLDEAARLMRYVFGHPDEAAATGARAQAHIASDHSPVSRADFICERFDVAQAAVLERNRFVREYYAAFQPDRAPLPEVPPVPALPDAAVLVGLAAQGLSVEGASSYPRVGRFVRRVVRRVLRHHDAHMRSVDVALARQIEALTDRVNGLGEERRGLIDAKNQLYRANEEFLTWLNGLKSRLDQVGGFVSASNTTYTARFAEIQAIAQVVSDHDDRISRFGLDVESLARTVRSEQDVIEGLVTAAQELQRRVASPEDARRIVAELRALPYMRDPDEFTIERDGKPALGFRASATQLEGYSGFEDIFRGPESLILERLSVYLPDLVSNGPVIDLGSGRGEMLQLLKEAGIPAVGVDSDESMVERAGALGLETVAMDALSYLRMQPDASVGAVFSAQFVEHIAYDDLVEVIAESRRVLRPGGVLIMETVNPYPVQSFRTFWTDLTHRAPIFPEVLLALVRGGGFIEGSVRFPSGSGDLEADRWTDGSFAVIATR